MNDQNQFDWVDFYKEFATKLIDYKDKRQELVSKVIDIFDETEIKMPTLEKDNNLIDIDPFTIFGLFNKKLTDDNRIKILSAIAKIFGIKTKVPTSFDSLPVLNPRNATFYYFIGDRGDNDIDDLWKLFLSALYYDKDKTRENKEIFSKNFDLVINKKGNGNSKITMGLYWISPDTFINLDSRNTWYIYESGKIPESIVKKLPSIEGKISARNYFMIIDVLKNYLLSGDCALEDFKTLSFDAWVYSEEINKQKEAKKVRKSKAAFLRWFNPLIKALRDLGGSSTPTNTRLKIIENEKLSDEEISITRGKNKVNKFENEVAFASSYLSNAGYIDKSVYGIWTLTESGKTVNMTDELASEIFKNVISANTQKSTKNSDTLESQDDNTMRYWLYAPGEGSSMWDEFYESGIMAIGWGEIGDLSTFPNKEAMKDKMKEVYDKNLSYKNSAHATWQFVNEMKIGDIIFVKKGMHEIIGRGIVMSDYEYDIERNDTFRNIRQIDWTHKGEWPHPGQAAMKTLTDITPYTDYVEKLKSLFEDELEEDAEEIEKIYPLYKRDDFLSDVYMSVDEYENLVGLLRYKKNIVLQGPPGVGKTFAAKRLAYSIMGVKDIERVMMVQFHQSYSYEDFIMGFRPSSNGFELKKGAFYNFCKKAEIDGDNDYFFIIDEINRGNLSKIFGELFVLLENDKRGQSLQLLYADEKFSIPKNIYIIGMMNTADRSLAMIDYALRRRFAFYELKPGFSSDGFIKYQNNLNNQQFDNLINCIENLNKFILTDEFLGEGFCIGHSYFCNLSGDTLNNKTLSGIVEYELIPLLKEYWFDEVEKVEEWSNNLRSAIK